MVGCLPGGIDSWWNTIKTIIYEVGTTPQQLHCLLASSSLLANKDGNDYMRRTSEGGGNHTHTHTRTRINGEVTLSPQDTTKPNHDDIAEQERYSRNRN